MEKNLQWVIFYQVSLCKPDFLNNSLTKQSKHKQNNKKTLEKVLTLNASCIAELSNPALHAPLVSSVSSHVSTYCLLCVMLALQKGAMKPYTCAIMTPESLGDESTFVMWNSAHVWQGKPSAKESATQVRCAFRCYSASVVSCFLLSSLLLFGQ